MKISFKIKVTLLILGTLLTFSSAFVNLNEKSNTNISNNQEVSSKMPDAKPLISGSWTASFIYIILDNWSDPCEYVQERAGTLADPHIIENMTIDAKNSPIYGGILIAGCEQYFIIRNCSISNAAYGGGGIYLVYTTHGKIENNTCTSNDGFGVFLYGSPNNTIIDNEINNNGQGGIIVEPDFDLTAYSDNNTIINNTISNNNQDGILLSSCENNTIRGNIIENNGWDGIWIDDSDKNTIYNNTISNNEYGVFLTDSSYNKVFNNTFVSNNQCIVEMGTCIGNILTPNTCIPNSIAPSSDDDDGGGDGSNAPKISGYDLVIISLTIIIASSALSFVLLKKRTRS